MRSRLLESALRLSISISLFSAAIAWESLVAASDSPAVIDFNTHIRPILSDKCFACHGPDEEQREGGFRLDQKESALGEADSGSPPIVPGDVDDSELVARILSDEEGYQMPPAETNKILEREERSLLIDWIEQGADWQPHWSLVSPQRPSLPEVDNPHWLRNEIDRFILARLQQEGLRPSVPTDKQTLLRRVTFDLTGLPPTPEEVDAFMKDHSPGGVRKGRRADCWPRRATASTWPASGWMQPAMATRTACTWTTTARCGPIAIG